MNRLSQRVLATLAAFALLLAPVVVAAQTPAPAAQAAPRKLISPQRGEANIEITKPDTKLSGSEVTTVIMVKNVSPAPIAGFKIEENWYDKSNTPSGGGVYRHPRPLMPNEVIRVELKTPRNPRMNTNQYQFTHANGSVKPKVVPKLVATPPATS
jgi:hypothetical protein